MYGLHTITRLNQQAAALTGLALTPVDSFDEIADRAIAARLAAQDTRPANLIPTPAPVNEASIIASRGHDEEQGGLRGHSIDRETYPFTVSARIHNGETGWYVWNALTGSEIDEFYGAGSCGEAHEYARQLKKDSGL